MDTNENFSLQNSDNDIFDIDKQCREIAKKIIGGKWTLHITFLLGKYGILRFGQLYRLCPGSTQATLAKQLDHLEEIKIVERIVYVQMPPKVEYKLTPLGQKLIPVVDALRDWSQEYKKEIY